MRRRRAVALLTVALMGMVAWATVARDRAPGNAARGAAGNGTSASAAGGAKPTPQLPPPASADEAVDRLIAGSGFVLEGGASKREIALTFDDGPGPYTGRLLAVLSRLQVRATFFVVGSMERVFGQYTVAEVTAGDAIGNHTQTHAALARLSPADQRTQLLEASIAIQGTGAASPRLFRPPYGLFDDATLAELKRQRMLMVLWSTDTRDYTQPGVQAIVQRALAGAKPGAIVLLHDAGGTRSQTIDALPAIVRGLRRRHYQLVTVPQLLLDDPPPPDQQLPDGLGGN